MHMTEPTGRRDQVRKLIRFARLYGWQRAVNKAVARSRAKPPGRRSDWARWLHPFVPRRPATISLIGCGQFAFSCLAYFLRKRRGNAFLSAFDTDPAQAQSLGRYYGFRHVADTPEVVFNNPDLRLIYVASNHASHAPYAIEGLRRNVDVYVEKPLAVTRTQLVELLRAQRQSTGQLYVGYNRPYARAIRLLRERVMASAPGGAFSINYVINGHRIPADHWYRRPDEGTRVCGNLGHWIDLTIHLLAWRELPDWIDIQIACAHPAEPDDNLSVTFVTDRHDLVTILLTARSEPFEGISESINVQYGNSIVRIDDFRRMTVWQGAERQTWRFTPKDVGHERAVLQPFEPDNRDWWEVELSTLLMLHIKDLVLSRRTTDRFVIHEQLTRLEADIERVSPRITLPTRLD